MLLDDIQKAHDRVGLWVFLMAGLLHLGTSQGDASTSAGAFPEVLPVKRDTVDQDPIGIKSCNSYSWFQANEGNWESEAYSGGIGGGSLSSLHEMTCKWAAYQRGLSLDSTQLPKYVRPIGDSLRLNGNILAYSVTMTEVGDRDPLYALYFVAEAGDSLFYKEVDKHYYSSGSEQSWEIRALRPLDVSGAVSQYIWFEYSSITDGTKNGNRYVSESWKGHIYTYDPERGVRFLQWAPIRSSVHKNGRLEGAKQWDVSVPEAGVMLVEPRLEKGKEMRLEPPEHWLGRHVIDSNATDVEPRPSRH